MRLLKFAATSATTLAIATGGVAGIVGASSVATNGPKSPVKIHTSNHQSTDNDNNTHLSNSNKQNAYSGDAKASGNTDSGDATTGMTGNTNGLDVTVTNTNTGAADMSAASDTSGDVSTQGPKSPIDINMSSQVKVNNDNNTTITNYNTQSASSGNAKVSGNTGGGSATTGDATNDNTVKIVVSNSN